MFCKKCGKLKANINISCTIGPIERHTKNINIGNKNTLFPYIGVDGRRFNNIIEKTKLNEVEAKLHIFQNVSAIKYLHFKKIGHMDQKP